MDGSRRGFLKIAGLTVLGATGGAAIKAKASGTSSGTAQAEAGYSGAKRLAMVIDLRKLKEGSEVLDRCIEACHKAHNVPDFGDAKNEVKWIWTESFETAFHEQEFHYIRADLENKPTLLLCNHCDNPPCTRVCPTQATWKRDFDGVVMMDWHRCIGCRYCIVACPYGSRSFNWKNPRLAENLANPDPNFPTRMRGVVEKCTFCEERLAKGLQPACVEACEDKELIFGDLNDPDSEVRQVLASNMAIRRKPNLGTKPEVYYIIEDPKTLQQPDAAVETEDVVKEGEHA